MERLLVFPILLCPIAFVTVGAFPFDYSDRECKDMFPEGLGVDAITHNHELPFEVEPQDSIFTDGGIKVTVRATGQENIKGILLQARAADGTCEVDPLGFFDSKTEEFVKTVKCGRGLHSMSAITNAEWGTGKKEFEFEWRPRFGEKRNVFFVATIVTGPKVFYTGVTSHVVRSVNGIDSNNTHGDHYPICTFRRKFRTGGQTGRQGSGAEQNVIHFTFFIVSMLSTRLLLFRDN